MKNKKIKMPPMPLEQAENMLAKPLLSANKTLFDKILNANLSLRKKPGIYDEFIALLKELFPKRERYLSIPITVLGIVFMWFFMWSYIDNSNLIFSTTLTTVNKDLTSFSSSTVDVNSIVVYQNPEEQVGLILTGKFWK